MSADYTIDEVPTSTQIASLINGLRPAFVEAYSRAEAAERFPDVAYIEPVSTWGEVVVL